MWEFLNTIDPETGMSLYNIISMAIVAIVSALIWRLVSLANAAIDKYLPPVVANQIELSLANSGVIDDGTLNATRARGAEVQAWSPLGGGDLLNLHSPVGGRVHGRLPEMASEFGMDPASLLLRWVASVPQTRVVLGSTKIERIRDAVHACAEPLPRDAWYALWEAARGKAVP